MSTLRETLSDLLATTVDEQIERIARMAVVGFANQTLTPEAAERVQRVLDALPPMTPLVNHIVIWNIGEDAPTTFLIGEIVAEHVDWRGETPMRQCRIALDAYGHIATWVPSDRLYVVK